MSTSMNSVAQTARQVKTVAALQYVIVTPDDLELTTQERADLTLCYQQGKQAPALGDHPGFLFARAMYRARDYAKDCDYIREAEARAEARTFLMMWRQIRALLTASAESERKTFWGDKEA